MSFYDMAAESKENQFKWFMKLSETQGLEAAHKYAEILSQIPMHLEPPVMPKPPTMAMNTPPIPNVDLMFENLVNAPSLTNLLTKKDHLPNDATPFSIGGVGVGVGVGNKVASSLSNRNGSDHTSIASINDLINQAHQSELNLQAKNQQQQHQQQQQLQKAASQPPPQSAQSVPLYQRQAGATYNMHANNLQANNMQMPLAATMAGNDLNDHNLFENLFNHNGGLSQGHAANDLLGNAQHFQGLPPLSNFVSPVKSMSNSVHLTQK